MSKKKKTPKKQNSAKPVSKPKESTTTTRPVQDLSAPNSFWTNTQLHLLIIFFLSCGLYLNTTFHQYAVDDSIVILRNQYTKKGFAGLHGLFTEDTFTGFFGKKRNLVAGGRYRPLSLATFAVELEIFGDPIVDQNGNPVLDADGDKNYRGSPAISHIINLLLYAWLCVVVYLMLLQMFNPKRDQDNLKGYFIAFVGAMLYVTHPIHTEAVANIKGRDEIMVLLGSILAVYWVLKAAASESSKAVIYHIGAAIAFILALFSKENAVTFLAIIPAALYFFTRKAIPEIAIQTAPYVLIAGAFWFGVRGQILGDVGSVVGTDTAPAIELMNDPFLKLENGVYVHYTTEERLATVFYTWLKYIKLLVLPHPLTNDYYPKHIRTDADIIPTYAMPQVMFSILLHLGLIALLALGTLRKKAFAFFILFYFATFSVVSNLIFPIGSNMAERFMFLPSVGFSALCAMGLYHLVERASQKTSIAAALKTPVAIFGVLCVLYSLKTVVRNPAWFDDYTLFTTDIVNSPHSAKLNNAVSGVLQEKANKTTNQVDKKDFIERALEHSNTAISLHPTYNNAWLLYGNANVMLGNIAELEGAANQNAPAQGTLYGNALKYFDEAIRAYTEVTRLRPNHPDVKRNMGVVYRDRGKLLGQRLGQLDGSIQSLEKSVSFSGSNFESFRLLGVAYGMKGAQFQQAGRYDEGLASHYKAIEYFEQALEMVPTSVPILYNLEIAYRHLNQADKVEEYNSRWRELDPNYDPSQQQ